MWRVPNQNCVFEPHTHFLLPISLKGGAVPFRSFKSVCVYCHSSVLENMLDLLLPVIGSVLEAGLLGFVYFLREWLLSPFLYVIDHPFKVILMLVQAVLIIMVIGMVLLCVFAPILRNLAIVSSTHSMATSSAGGSSGFLFSSSPYVPYSSSTPQDTTTVSSVLKPSSLRKLASLENE